MTGSSHQKHLWGKGFPPCGPIPRKDGRQKDGALCGPAGSHTLVTSPPRPICHFRLKLGQFVCLEPAYFQGNYDVTEPEFQKAGVASAPDFFRTRRGISQGVLECAW